MTNNEQVLKMQLKKISFEQFLYSLFTLKVSNASVGKT